MLIKKKKRIRGMDLRIATFCFFKTKKFYSTMIFYNYLSTYSYLGFCVEAVFACEVLAAADGLGQLTCGHRLRI